MMKTELLFGIVASSKTRVRCVVCGVYIPKAKKCIEQHTNGAKHKENVELMTENGITYKDNMFYCKPCTLELSVEDSVVNHIESDEHSNWVAAAEDLIDGEYITLEPFLTSDEDHAHCEVCQSTFHCTLPNIESHVNGIIHRTNITEHLKPLNAIFSIENTDIVWCKICNTSFANTAESILEHIDDDDEHRNWFDTIEELIEDQDISINSFLSNAFDNNAFCNKCQVAINCNFSCIEYHINREPHFGYMS